MEGNWSWKKRDENWNWKIALSPSCCSHPWCSLRFFFPENSHLSSSTTPPRAFVPFLDRLARRELSLTYLGYHRGSFTGRRWRFTPEGCRKAPNHNESFLRQGAGLCAPTCLRSLASNANDRRAKKNSKSHF